jgi:hypothetical protein
VRLAARRPAPIRPARDRLRTDTVFIHRPEFNSRIRMLALLFVSCGLKLFLRNPRHSSQIRVTAQVGKIARVAA